MDKSWSSSLLIIFFLALHHSNQFFYKMILISFALALIAIVYGAKLLAQSQKESLGALYKYLAWFVIAMGFCVLLCDGVHGILRMHSMRQDGMMRHEMMRGGDCMMGGGPMWMHHHRDMCNDNNCCDGMMNCGPNNNCCDPANMNCHDGSMNSSCKGGMPADCPMMGNMKCCKSDSVKEKK